MIRKFKAKETKSKESSSHAPTPASEAIDEIGPNSGQSLEIVQQQPFPPIHNLAPAIEDRATGFFVTNFVVGLSGPTRGHLDYLIDLHKSQSVDEGLVASIQAVGLAGYSHAAHAPSLLTNARYQYLKALQHTNAALKSPTGVKKDSTLLAIFILGIFEAVTGVNQKSLKSWAEHVNGAAAVVKLRGRDQVSTPHGRRMLVQVTSSLLISCIARGLPLPDHIRELMEECRKLFDTPDPAFIIQDTMMEFANFRAGIMKGTISDPDVIVARSLELDGILLAYHINPPVGWEYESVYTEEKFDVVYKGRYDVYFDYWIAQVWNAMRTIRIMLHEQIRATLLRGFNSKPPRYTQSEHTAQFQISTDLVHELQAEIIASVPQHLGCISKSPSANSDRFITNLMGYLDADSNMIRMSGGYFLIWPLWFCGVMDTATEEVQQYVMKILRSIGRNMGIQQANVLADVVEAKTGITVW